MVNQQEMAPSPRQPLSRRGVRRISGYGQTQTVTTTHVHGTTQLEQQLKIGTINVATLRQKEEELVEMMKMRDISILAVEETRMSGKGDRVIHENYRLIYSGGEDNRHGVAIILTDKLAPYVEKIDQVSERILGIDMKIEAGVGLIQVYAPQQGRPTLEKDEFYQQLQETMESMKYQTNLIICGDWNGHIGNDRRGYEQNMGVHGIGERNVEGQRILNFAMVNNLSIMNTYYEHRESHKWTWYRYNHQMQEYTQKSMIDLFLTNNRNVFMDVKAVPSVSMDADHRLVMAKVRLRKPKSRRKVGMRRYKLTKLKDPEQVERLKNAIEEKCQAEDESMEEGADELWKILKNRISEATNEVLGEKKPYQGKKKMTPWWSTEVREAVKYKMKRFRRWMKTRTAEDRMEYVIARNEAERVKKDAKDSCWKQIGEDLENDLHGTKKLLYSLAKSYRGKNSEVTYAIKDKQGNLLTELEEIGTRWGEYFGELLNVEEEPIQVNESDVEDEHEPAEEANPITMDELRSAISDMKKGKSPGEDGLPVEILRAGGECVMQQLLRIINAAYVSEAVPVDWQRGVISPLFKKGEKTVCDNYRGVTLLSHAGKIYSMILERRLRVRVEDVLNDAQYGFRPGRGTTDAIFIVKMILEKSWEWGIDKFALFIDLEKAFDRIDRNGLWQILCDPHYNIPKKLIRVIRSMYSQCSSKIMTQGIESENFDIKSGL